LDLKPTRIEALSADKTLPRLWLVHDSFGVLLRMMLPPFFSRTACDWNGLGDLDPPAVLAFAPNLVIDVHTERQVFLAPPDLIESADRSERATRFERARPVWKLAGSARRFTAEKNLTCAVEGDELVLAAQRPRAGLVLNDVDTGVEGTAILRLDLEVEGEG